MNTTSIYKSTAGRDEIMAVYNRVLAQWPVPCEHVNMPTRHGRTFVMACGHAAAPPLVLLHGTASNSATWAGDVVEYSRNFRVLAVDIPGEPGRSHPARFSWDGPAFAEWLDDVLNGLNVDRVFLGGMSLGGWAALKYALFKSERVRRLVLISPSGIYPPRLSFALRAVFFMLWGQWGQNRLKQYIFKGLPLPPDLDQFLTLVNRHFKFRLGAPPLFSDAELRSLGMPVLFLAGEQDVLLNTLKTADRLQKLAPNLTLKLFKEDGHAVINLAAHVTPFLLADETVSPAPGVVPYLR
jgi:pimeloyl-ACP methyl ester carboxylesterase